MFELVNLVFSLGLLTAQALNITLHTQKDVILPPMGQVALIELSSAPYVLVRLRPKTEEERCRYTGLVAPYERTWEEETESFGIKTVHLPEPGKIAGYAIVVNRKDCEGREPEPMFRVSTHYRTLFNSDKLMEGATLVSVDLAGLPEEKRPKWVAQFLETTLIAAESNPYAKEFMAFSEQTLKRVVVKSGAIQ